MKHADAILSDADMRAVLDVLVGRGGLGRTRATAAAARVTPSAAHTQRRERVALLNETAHILDEVAAVLRRYVVWSYPEQVDFVALWVLHTWVFDLFETTCYLDVSSAAKGSGKSRLVCEVLLCVVPRLWPVTARSEAALFRKVDAEHPTLLLDEVDATFRRDPTLTEGLRGILNTGYRRGATVPGCVGADFEIRDFDVYCPKAFAGLDGLPDTVRDRSGRIELQRRSSVDEPKPARFRRADALRRQSCSGPA